MSTIDRIAEPLRSLAVPLESLNLDPRNARKHGKKNMLAITSSLERFGQRLPVVVQRDGMVVRAGNGRVMAARGLGWSHIAALVVDDDDAMAVAFALADNRTGELAAWDDENLTEALSFVAQNGGLEDLIGFEAPDLSRIIGKADAREVAVSAHLRTLGGDSGEPEDGDDDEPERCGECGRAKPKK